jgi:hypothetical protein
LSLVVVKGEGSGAAARGSSFCRDDRRAGGGDEAPWGVVGAGGAGGRAGGLTLRNNRKAVAAK